MQGTRVFTLASGNPVSDGVAIGDRVSVYPDGTTPNGVYYGKVSARDATTITVSSTGDFGTSPANGSSNTTLRVGGAWKGPNGTSIFPFNIITDDTGTNDFRINLKNDQTYTVSVSISAPTMGNIKVQGYTTSYNDLGRATIDGGSSGASYSLYTGSGNNHKISDIIFQNNGSTGSATLVDCVGAQWSAERCVFKNSCGAGATFSNMCLECELFNNNLNNTSSLAGFFACGQLINCISHDNAGSNSAGFLGGLCYRCISDTNGGHGFYGSSVIGCDAYNNGGDGYNTSILSATGFGACFYIENSNAIKNGGWGFNLIAQTLGIIAECRYGAGTQANTSGGLQISATAGYETVGAVSAYTSDVAPWADPANGDFRITLPAAIGAGRGAYTQIAPGYSGTISYPDIGAAQARPSYRVYARASGGMNG